jgi:DNA-binding winged helix-turn-helix (wHTH) protein
VLAGISEGAGDLWLMVQCVSFNLRFGGQGFVIYKLQPTAVRFGMFELDLQTAELRKNGRTIPLNGQPVKLLTLLVTRPGELVTREEIEKTLWPDRIVEFEHAINDAVKKVRRALLDDPDRPKYIETLHGRGYRFIAAVQVVQPADAPVQVMQPADPLPAADAPSPRNDAPTPKNDFVLPIPAWLSRGLFVLIQIGYLAIHAAVLFYVDALEAGLIALGITPIHQTLPAVIAFAMCSIALRIYLLSAIGWAHPGSGKKFRQLFPVLLIVDAFWAASPLLVEELDLGIVLAGIAGLAYVPFAERTLVRSLYPQTAGRA